jgi:catechol 2,3-dioxygenase-like lactoylglutathione lyase family enzyme
MLRRIDRLLIRVPQVPAAVRYYRDVLGMTLQRQEGAVAAMGFAEGEAELILHADPDLPDQAVYLLVDDVREMWRRRGELKLSFTAPPTPVARGFKATVRDPFGTILLLLDRSAAEGAGEAVEDARPPGALFPGIEVRTEAKRELLIRLYEQIGRTADDLPYTPHFEALYRDYTAGLPEPKPSRQEVWRHLLNLRKSAKLPKLGEARSQPPVVSEEERQRLRELLGAAIGRRDRLPYTVRFDQLVDEFNRSRPRPLSPHLVWRLVATLAK